MNIKRAALIALLLSVPCVLYAQRQYDLNAGWQCIKASAIKETGEAVSDNKYLLKGWMPATVPGTVLTSLLQNKLVPDPFYGMNNKLIPDIYEVGRDHYTYWFVKDFSEKTLKDELAWLQFRGVNNSFDVYLNGHKLNEHRDSSMYLRHEYNITPYLAKDGNNRLAVIVYPPNPVGNPNGGQGGDGVIAHNVTNQYTAGWDWIQPVHDRNTGIWDKVFIKKTKLVKLGNTHIVTQVPGIRKPYGAQPPAKVTVTVDVKNVMNTPVRGTLRYELGGKVLMLRKQIAAHTSMHIKLPVATINNPRLWWPNGYGPQNLYRIKVRFITDDKTICDEEAVTFGLRQLDAVWNAHTQSRELRVNGQKIFIKGGNWICSDEMMRCSKERYDAEVRYHHDMNLNLIRVWGGGLTERPEFYDACDKYGLLVMQDFWVSGDCNGRWYDPLKLEDTNARRNYPDDHKLLAASMADQAMMLRNHPSLAFWCGGNEIRPPADVLRSLRDSILPTLDGTRFLFEYSNDDSMSLAAHDGPYTIQRDTFFWNHRSWGFNSEVGSVGIGDYESLQRFIPAQNMVLPYYDTAAHKWQADSVWQYHKYVSYDSAVEAYGHPKTVTDFAKKAQLVNYNQYRALMEGASTHMWDWYTGIIEWKTQNPWTAMVGQMYDVYLDPNACLYGMMEGAKPLHIMYDPINRTIIVANNSCDSVRVTAEAHIGKKQANDAINIGSSWIPANSCKTVYTFSKYTPEKKANVLFNYLTEGSFLSLRLMDAKNHALDENTYALPDTKGSYQWLSKISPAVVFASARHTKEHKIEIDMKNHAEDPVAYFIHVYLVDKKTKKRILPVFCNNNYISVLPAQVRSVVIDYPAKKGGDPMVCIEGWNVQKQYIEIKPNH